MSGCEEQATKSQIYENRMELAESNNLGCIRDSVVLQTADSGRLRWQYRNDTLSFSLSYTANCCSKFRDSVAVKLPDALAINLIDTTVSLCRCLCTHQSDFIFFAPGLADIRISCAVKELDQSFVSILDTLIVVE